MKKNYWGNTGIAIHLMKTEDGTYPLDNIGEHAEAGMRDPYGRFYLSCGYYFKDLSKVDYLLLYCNDGPKNHNFFAAKVKDKSVSHIKPFCPDDAAVYSPEKWACEKKRTWFMLSDLKVFVSPDALEQLVVTSEGRENTFLNRIKCDLPLGCCYVHGPLLL